MVERISMTLRILRINKKGVSMVELIAYVALYGVVMSLLASLVFVIVNTARKVNAQSILNRGSSVLYTSFMSEVLNLNPDYIVLEPTDGNTISILFEKYHKIKRDDDNNVESVLIEPDDPEYLNKPVKMRFSYTKEHTDIDVTYIYLDNSTSTSTINLDFGMKITEPDSDDITDVFKIIPQNSSISCAVINGNLHYDNKKMEFNFVIPIYIQDKPGE